MNPQVLARWISQEKRERIIEQVELSAGKVAMIGLPVILALWGAWTVFCINMLGVFSGLMLGGIVGALPVLILLSFLVEVWKYAEKKSWEKMKKTDPDFASFRNFDHFKNLNHKYAPLPEEKVLEVLTWVHEQGHSEEEDFKVLCDLRQALGYWPMALQDFPNWQDQKKKQERKKEMVLSIKSLEGLVGFSKVKPSPISDIDNRDFAENHQMAQAKNK